MPQSSVTRSHSLKLFASVAFFGLLDTCVSIPCKEDSGSGFNGPSILVWWMQLMESTLSEWVAVRVHVAEPVTSVNP